MKRILNYLKYKSVEDIPKRIADVLNESLSELRDVLVPETAWDRFAFQRDDEKNMLIFDDDLFFQNEKVYNTLKDADDIIISISTIGRKYDEAINELKNKNQILKLFMYDAIGKSVIDSMILNFRIKMSEVASEEGKGISKSFLPGLNGWNLDAQEVVFSLIDAKKIGVELNESLIMIPAKSSSEVFGIGSGYETRNVRNKCQLCDLKNCMFRNKEADAL